MPRAKSKTLNQSLLQKLQSELQFSQSYISLVLGLLIVLVAGILVFNYFNKDKGSLGPAQQTGEQQPQSDVAKENLPGQYTVKAGDTLFTIASKYYNDGYQYLRIAQENKLVSADSIEVGQVLTIPKTEEVKIADTEMASDNNQGIGGEINSTIWGPAITGDTYTVVADDWLSKIAGRAYGDVMAFDKIAKANNIANPDLIEPGTVLKIPR